MLYSAWVVLFFTQTALIATARVGWHRVLGSAAVLLVIWFVVSDALFERPMGEALVRGLIATFVW